MKLFPYTLYLREFIKFIEDMNSGVKVCPSCDKDIQDLEQRRLEYVIFKLENVDDGAATRKTLKPKQKIVVECKSQYGESAKKLNGKESKAPAPWYRFTEQIQENSVRYGCCYFTYTTRDGREEEKLVFLFYCNESGSINDKMTYSSSKASLIKKVNVAQQLQADSKNELLYEEVVDQVRKLK